MSDDRIQPGAKVSNRLWDEFRADVKERRGTVRGHLGSELENAIREYIDASHGGDVNDRLRRLEQDMGNVQETLRDIHDGQQAQKEKTSGPSATTLNRLDDINARIQQEAGDALKVHESVINAAIEDVAGASAPTLRRYKQMLKERHIAFENPSETSDTWFVDEDVFVSVVESNWPHRNQDIAKLYGESWYDDVRGRVIDDSDDTGRSFQ